MISSPDESIIGLLAGERMIDAGPYKGSVEKPQVVRHFS